MTTRRSCSRRSPTGFAEAAAEHFHERVRRELWGYAAGETLTNEQLAVTWPRSARPPVAAERLRQMTCTLHVAWDERLTDYHFGLSSPRQAAP